MVCSDGRAQKQLAKCKPLTRDGQQENRWVKQVDEGREK